MLSLSFKKGRTKEQLFWNWFSKKSKTYFNYEEKQEYLFNQLKLELEKINPDLVFEFSTILQDGTRNFVISADGIKSVFPIVRSLVEKAPQLKEWNIIAFRQPHKIISINYNGTDINLDDIYFRFAKVRGKINLEINIRDFQETIEWRNTLFILLDNLIGEYYTEMSLNSIETKLLDEKQISNLFTIKMLPNIVREHYEELNN